MDGIQATSSSGKRKLSHPEGTVYEDVHEGTGNSDVDSCGTASPPFSVSIVGGGIAGLGAALALQQRGFRVTVFERDLLFEDRRQGYGLTLTNNPQGPLAELDILDECISRDCPSNAHWIFAPEGDVLGYYGRSFKSDAETSSSYRNTTAASQDFQLEGRGNLRIPRQNLRRMMLDRLRPGTVRWGMKLLDYDESEDGVKCYFQSTSIAQSSSREETCHTDDNMMPTCEEKSYLSDAIKVEDNNEEIHADILVGADGIRSVVRQLRSRKVGALGNKQLIKESSPLNFVGVAVILGISTVSHPLINRQGFYCLDGTNRLFTMPFEDGDSKPYVRSSSSTGGSPGTAMPSSSSSAQQSTHTVHVSKSIDCQDSKSANQDGKTKLTMWQLSFSDFTEEEGVWLRSAKPEELLNEALRRCKDWFNPVCDMIRRTPAKEVWGTGLYDRDPMPLRTKDQGSRVTVIGDACHPMSMFKGQGANQALCDGPLLASWLHSGGSGATKNAMKSTSNNSHANKMIGTELNSQNVYTRLRCFEREMVARTTAKVLGSRAAAAQLHSPAALTEHFGVEGVKTTMSATLLRKVHELKIGAHHSSDLESKLRHVIEEIQTEIKSGLVTQAESPQAM